MNRTLLACVAICLAILVFDASTPLGYAEWMLYLLPLLLAFWRLHRRQLAYVASLSMVFLGLGFVLSPAGIPWNIALYNRALGGGVLLLMTIAYVQFKKMNEAQRQSEEKYRTLVEGLHEGIWAIDKGGYTTFANAHMAKMLGYSVDEMQGKHLFSFMDERGVEIAKRLLERRKAGVREVHEFEFLRKDGTRIYTALAASPVTDESGNYIGALAGVIDLSERKRMEEEIRSMARFPLENPNPVLRLGKDGTTLTANEASLPLLREWNCVLGQAAPKSWCDLVTEVLSTGLGKDVEVEFNGKIYLFFAKPITETGEVNLYGRDITERKRMEEQIKLLRQQEYNALLRATIDGFSRVDTSGRFLDVNDAYSRMVGYSREELLKMRILDVEAKESTEETARHFRKVLVGSDRFETRHRCKDGKLIDIDVSAKYLETDGGQFFVFLRDITERKRLEERLRQAERLAAVCETAAMVGHDLRNPLQGIAGALHLLRQESLTAKERDEMLQLIQSCVEYSDAIIRDLSEYSAEILELALADTTPKSLTREAIQAIRIPPTVSVQDLTQTHPTLKVDMDRFKRVLVNLIKNAIDAMPNGGTLTISSRLWNDAVEITVSDTGSGMPEKVMERLWKPLQTTKAKGMGLGLAICKRIVDAHGGSISVKSKPGEGTTVTIGLPIKPVRVEVKRK
jgi:PAS domain S-box-containing protein